MYRPKRFGEHEFVDVDVSAWTPFTSASDFNEEDHDDFDAVYPVVESAAVPDVVNYRSMVIDYNMDLASKNHVSFGVPISGSVPESCDAVDCGIIYEVSGSILVAGPDCVVWPFIARVHVSGGALTAGVGGKRNEAFRWMPLKAIVGEAGSDADFEAAHTHAVVQRRLIEGTDWSANPMIAGWSVFNPTSSANTVEHVRMECAIYRYVTDLETFDPNR